MIEPALNPSFSWETKDIFTQETFRELKDKAYEGNSPYYVFVQVDTKLNPQTSSFYDGLSWRSNPQKDPLTREKILRVQYFAVKVFKIEGGNLVKTDNERIISFPPRNYYSPSIEIPYETFERFCFSAVNFFSMDQNILNSIKQIRGVLKNYLTLRAANPNQNDYLNNYFLHETLLWKISEQRTLAT